MSSDKKKIKVVYCGMGEEATVVELDADLYSYQQAVGGGLIQGIRPFLDESITLVCNDEGKINGMELNRVLYDEVSGKVLDYIFGPFFICGTDDNSFGDLTDEQAEKYRKMFLFSVIDLGGIILDANRKGGGYDA